MRIVLDMQGVQLEIASGIRNGPLVALTLALLRNRAQHEVFLAVRAGLTDTVEQVRAAVHDLLARGNVRVWHPSGPLGHQDARNSWVAGTSACILDAFITELEPDVVVIPQFISANANGCAVSINTAAKRFETIVVMGCPGADAGAALRSGEVSNQADHREQISTDHPAGLMPPMATDRVVENSRNSNIQVRYASFEMGRQTPDLFAKQLVLEIDNIQPPVHEVTETRIGTRKRLAYVSPLPPQRSGISDYSADLLPELARFYDIEVVVNQVDVSTPWIQKNCKTRDVNWVLNNIGYYDRVIYHFGNSSYHEHMFDMLTQLPGVVVLHDFYLGDISYFIESHEILKSFFSLALYKSHGYAALAERFKKNDPAVSINKYPSNLEILQTATGIIVHSEFSRQLADQWYGKNFSADWSVIPLLRKPAPDIHKNEARVQLGFQPDDFLVCSFGLLGPGKLNQRLLTAWLNSELARSTQCHLIFVGENHSGEYGDRLYREIKASAVENRIHITGWTDATMFQAFLAAADIAVQLRTNSRGETSAAVLDCMSHALPTIVNAHGSFVELPEDAVWMLSEEFDDHELSSAMETLWHDSEIRLAMGARARSTVQNIHNVDACACQYASAIERSYERSDHEVSGLIRAITGLEMVPQADAEVEALARAIAFSMPEKRRTRQLLVDVSATCRNDLKTGIQRVVRALVWELIHAPPNDYRVEPVYLTDEGGEWHYRYARTWTSDILGIPNDWMPDNSVDFAADDILLIADFTSRFAVEAEQSGMLAQLKEIGVVINFFVYDLLPIKRPEFFPPGQFGFVEWIKSLTRIADGAICISQSVAEDLEIWMHDHTEPRIRSIKVDWFHLGADIDCSAPTIGLPQNARKQLALIKSLPSFLMVGTIEPRKGYLQVIDAFTELWKNGAKINLVIVGKEGWLGLPETERRTIPDIVERLRNHPELGIHLLWMDSASDEFLLQIYATSTCLIAASEGEGFGLPLIEAAQHEIPIIARDIPVFREVAGQHAYYFDGLAPENLVNAINEWLDLRARGKTPSSCGMPWLTWKQSSLQVIEKMGLNRIA